MNTQANAGGADIQPDAVEPERSLGLAGTPFAGIDGWAVERELLALARPDVALVDEHARADLLARLFGVWLLLVDGPDTRAGRLGCDAVDFWSAAKLSPEIRRWCGDRCGFEWDRAADLFVGVARIDGHGDGGWTLADAPGDMRAGRAVVTIPIFDWQPAMVGDARIDAALAWRGMPRCVDIVAVDPTARAKRWILNGATWVLCRGDAPGERGAQWPGRIRLFADAFGWLAAGAPAGGYCVIDWTASEALDLLRQVDAGRIEVICDDARHLGWLRRRARPARAKLRLMVAGGRGAGALEGSNA